MKIAHSPSRSLFFVMTSTLGFLGSCGMGAGSDASTQVHDGDARGNAPLAAQSFLGKCGAMLTQEQYAELLELTDIATFSDFRQAAPRATRIAEIFAEAKDRRGIFASMYVEITKESVGSTQRGEYADDAKAGELVKRFAERYFVPLHAHLLAGSARPQTATARSLGGPYATTGAKEWKRYYELAETCRTSDLRVLGTGVNNHMTLDLPYALAEIRAPVSFKDDFLKFGNILIEKKQASTALLATQQNVDAVDFFDLMLLGKIIETFMEKGTAAKWGFQLIRAEAWNNGRVLQSEGGRAFAEASIGSAHGVRQNVLRFVPSSR